MDSGVMKPHTDKGWSTGQSRTKCDRVFSVDPLDSMLWLQHYLWNLGEIMEISTIHPTLGHEAINPVRIVVKTTSTIWESVTPSPEDRSEPHLPYIGNSHPLIYKLTWF